MPLTELKNHLHQLTDQSVYPFKQTSQQQTLQPFIRLLPDMLADVQRWCDANPGETNLKRLYSYLLAYVFHGDDLLPEVEHGFWGYLDDAYIVGLAIAKTWGESPLTDKALPDYLPKIQGWLTATQQVIPDESRVIQRIFGQMLMGQYAQFDDVLMQEKI